MFFAYFVLCCAASSLLQTPCGAHSMYGVLSLRHSLLLYTPTISGYAASSQ